MQVGPAQPGAHTHSNPVDVSKQLPPLWQGSERQACSAAPGQKDITPIETIAREATPWSLHRLLLQTHPHYSSCTALPWELRTKSSRPAGNHLPCQTHHHTHLHLSESELAKVTGRNLTSEHKADVQRSQLFMMKHEQANLDLCSKPRHN